MCVVHELTRVLSHLRSCLLVAQAVVRSLATGQPLLLLREPENAAHAVAVRTLSGAAVGYVPRGLGTTTEEDCTTARVAATGTDAAGVAWAAVDAKPAVPSMTA